MNSYRILVLCYLEVTGELLLLTMKLAFLMFCIRKLINLFIIFGDWCCIFLYNVSKGRLILLIITINLIFIENVSVIILNCMFNVVIVYLKKNIFNLVIYELIRNCLTSLGSLRKADERMNSNALT